MLRSLAPDLWTLESTQRMGPLLTLPARAVVARIGGDLWLHSPVALDDATARAVDELGRVRWIVAPSRYHHLHVGPASARWPEAEIWGAPGLAGKRPDLSFTGELGRDAPSWGPDLTLRVLEGAPEFSEVVFLHRPSGALVVTDVLFNVREASSALVPALLTVMGTWKRFAVSRLWRTRIRDRDALARAVEDLLSWDVRCVVPAHGEPVVDDAAAHLRDALAPLRA